MSVNDYNLVFEDRGAYLYAHVSGKDSFAACLSYWHAIADKVAEFGLRKLLVHENLEGDISEGEIFDLMVDLKDSGLLGIRIAFFDENDADSQINNLGRLVANNRGGNVCIFQSLEAAQSWIERED